MNQPLAKKFTVAVYESLLRGLSNHRYLEFATFLREDTLAGYDMYSLVAFPAIIPGRGFVKVEVYEVNEDTLRSLDRLEGHPCFYERVVTMTQGGLVVWVYVMRDASRLSSRVESGDWRHHYKLYHQ